MSNKWFPIGVIASLLVLVSCTATPHEGNLSITTKIYWSEKPAHGTFEVIKGADVLGCELGSFVDTELDSSILKELTCESGERSGMFTIELTFLDTPGPGDAHGTWSVIEATDEFSGLSGGGDFSVLVNHLNKTSVERINGEIQFTP